MTTAYHNNIIHSEYVESAECHVNVDFLIILVLYYNIFEYDKKNQQ